MVFFLYSVFWNECVEEKSRVRRTEFHQGLRRSRPGPLVKQWHRPEPNEFLHYIYAAKFPDRGATIWEHLLFYTFSRFGVHMPQNRKRVIRCHVELLRILCLMNYISPYYPRIIPSKLLGPFLLKREPAILNLIVPLK